MRIRRTADSPILFRLSTLFSLLAFAAVAVLWGAVGVLTMVACIVAQYCVFAFLAVQLVRRSPIGSQQPPRRWRLTQPDDGNTTWMCTTVHLVFLYVWHLFVMVTWLPAAHPLIWHTPTLGRMTLAQAEHAGLVAFALLLVTSFLSGIYAGDRFSRRICIETSTLLSFLHATHFAIP